MILLRLVTFISFISIICSQKLLYSGDDPGLVILHSSNFTSFITEHKESVIVKFYNPWCGHCVRFAPKWKQIAKELSEWKLVKVGVFDCLNDENTKLCRYFNIDSFPSIRYFPPNFQFGQVPVVGKLGNSETIKHSIIDFLTNLKEMDYLKYSNAKSKKELIFKIGLIFVIIEKQNSYIGREVILELSYYKKYFKIIRVLDSSELSKELLPKQNNYKLPLVLLLNDSESQLILSGNDIYGNSKYISTYIKSKYLPQNETMVLFSQPQKSSTSKDSSYSASNSELKGVHLADLYKGLRFILFKEITLQTKLDSNKLNIVKRFVDIIDLYFPFEDNNSKNFITMLSKWLSSKVHELEIEEYVDSLNKLEHKTPFLMIDEWKTCKGSSPIYRGYPCSLWLIFHTLTVNEYLKKSIDFKWSHLHEVLYTMRDYISNFFSCSECSHHFYHISKDLENSLVFANSSILWLWKTHNQVNKRIKGTATEDPEHPKIQFPSIDQCRACYKDGEFDEKFVLEYLMDRYGHLIKLFSKESDLTSESKSIEWPSILSKVDISMCLILYVISSFMLLALCFVLSLKRRKKKDSKTHQFNNI